MCLLYMEDWANRTSLCSAWERTWLVSLVLLLQNWWGDWIVCRIKGFVWFLYWCQKFSTLIYITCLCLARSLTSAYLFVKVAWVRQKQLVAGYLAYIRIEVWTVGAINLLMTRLCTAAPGSQHICASVLDGVWSCCIQLVHWGEESDTVQHIT